MLRHTGRAAVEVGHALHRVSHFLLTLTVVLSMLVIGGAWRLSRGPVDLGFAKDRLEKAVNNSISPVRVTFGGASIAWGGFNRGLDQPLVLRLTDLTVDSAEGASRVHIPVAEAGLSARWLLAGRVLPRTITLQGALLVLVRGADGSFSFAVGDPADVQGSSPLSGLLGVLGAPADSDRQAGGGRFSQLSAVAIHGATIRLDDRLLATTWTADRSDIDMFRRRGGGMDGKMDMRLALGGQNPTLTGSFQLAPGAGKAHVTANLSRVTPKALAAVAPVLAPLAALDVPLTVSGEADLGPDLTPEHISLTAQAGAGTIEMAAGSIPVHAAEFTLAGTMEQATLDNARIELQPAADAPITTVRVAGDLTHQRGEFGAALHLTMDRLDFSDLPGLWPPGLSPNTRVWITENIRTGTARDGKADLVLTSPDSGANVTLVNASGTLEGDNVAVTWLPSLPGVERGKAHLVLADPDRVEIDVRSARQKVTGGDAIAIPFGHVTVSGLSKKDQVATIQCEANGSIPSAIALLKEPRLHLLDRHPMDLRAPAGDARVNIHAVVPLELNLGLDDLSIHATANLSKVHLTGVVAGHDLDDGTFSLDVDTNHLSLTGAARLAGIQANVDGMMDFRGGPPSQVVQRYNVTGRTNTQVLAGVGLDTAGAMTGEVGLTVALNEYRSGDGDLTAEADLTRAELTVAPLAWRKPAGGAATGSARVNLSKDKLAGIDRIMVDGPGIQVRGAATMTGGKLDAVRLDRLLLGRTDVKGTVRLTPLAIDLTGPVLDVSAKLSEKRPKPTTEPPSGPPWSIRGRFDRVVLAHDQTATQLLVTAADDGRVVTGLTVNGKTGSDKTFSMRIGQGPAGNGRNVRRLAATVEDAGTVLHGLDITSAITGGVLTISGDFDDAARNNPLTGTLKISDFRVARAPALGKLLQAVTLYGLVDALGGPGMAFSSLTAPFQYDGETLVLRDARAFSPSLGLTVKGWIDRGGERLSLRGTLVPAYVFNSLLGRIPLIGGLFSAETGGGLFAMNYSLDGPSDNPTVTANPFSALTPGILRGMFGLFGQSSAGPDNPPAPEPPPGPDKPLDRQSAGGNAPQQ